MSISLCVLGSGSSGNCSLVTLNGGARTRHVLIDAGLAPRTTTRRLAPLGLGLGAIDQILVTHADCDHLHAAWGAYERRRFRWRLARRHVGAGLRAGLGAREIEPFDGPFELGGETRVDPVPLPHDQLGSTGYLIEHRSARLLFATDVGRVTAPLRERLRGISALAIESNYDRALEIASPRPDMIKRRVMGGMGHLSNEQALDAAVACARDSDLEHLVLLHLSRQCNDPGIVRGLYARRAPELVGRLTLTNQRVPTPVLQVRGGGGREQTWTPGRQLDFLEAMPGPS